MTNLLPDAVRDLRCTFRVAHAAARWAQMLYLAQDWASAAVQPMDLTVVQHPSASILSVRALAPLLLRLTKVSGVENHEPLPSTCDLPMAGHLPGRSGAK
eukprot:5377281-Pleurochrysis_carterae.AAC.2